ncbi:MAG: M91 family zinc metallopeptidase [Bryobacterales bacterium]
MVGLAITLEPDTAVRVGSGVEIRGTLEFRLVALGAIGQIASSPNGEALMKALHDSGKRAVIVETPKGNAVSTLPSEGADVTVFYNPSIDSTGLGGEEWEARPPAVGLAHALVRAEQAMRGTTKQDADESDQEAIGLAPFNVYPYSENKIREGWKPPQPPRERY